MKNYVITVNGTSYDVTVEEVGGAAPVAATPVAAPVKAAPAKAAAPEAHAGRPVFRADRFSVRRRRGAGEFLYRHWDICRAKWSASSDL